MLHEISHSTVYYLASVVGIITHSLVELWPFALDEIVGRQKINDDVSSVTMTTFAVGDNASSRIMGH